MNVLRTPNNAFRTDKMTTDAFNGLLKSANQVKPAIEYFKIVVAKNKIELINDNIFIIIDLIAELDKKVLTLVPEILSDRDEYSEHAIMRTEMYNLLGQLIKFGDSLLIHCKEYGRQNSGYENIIYEGLIAAIEGYVEEIKKTVNITDELLYDTGVDCIDSIDDRSSIESEGHYYTTTINQAGFSNPSSNESNSTNDGSNLSWCDDEHDISLLKRRGIIRDSNSSEGSNTDSKESGFLSDGSYDLDEELTSSWREFVSSRTDSSILSPRITFRESYALPSKGKEIIFGSSYTVDVMKTPKKRIAIDDPSVVLRKKNSRENLFDDEDTDTLIPEDGTSIPIQPVNANFIEYESVEQYLWMKNDEKGRIVQGATLDALIVYACNNKQKDYTDAFITMYKSFVDSNKLIEKLVYRFEYFVKKKPRNPEYYRIAKKTFALLLIIISELSNVDLSVVLMELLIDCTYRIITLCEIKMGRIFREYVIANIFEFKQLTKTCVKKVSLVDECIAGAEIINYTNILDIKPEILAQQICLLTHEILNNIKSSELLLYIDKQDIDIAPNFSILANHYNAISFWAATMILKESESKTRLRLMLYFIRVMRKLLEYQNFESCSALNSTFSNISIYRIMPDLKNLDEFIELFDPMRNFKIYRARINNAAKGPCIPILFLLIRDLIHIDNGNPNERHGLINFAKRYQIYTTLAKFRNAKINPYKFQRNRPVLKFLNNFEGYWNEEKLIAQSYVIKPRGKVIY